MLFDDPAALQPDDVLAWHELCSAGLQAERLETHRRLRVQAELPSYLNEILRGAAQAEVDEYFTSCQRELDLSAVLTLAASAEARLRRDATGRRGPHGDDLSKRLAVLRSNVSTDWRVPLYDNGIMEAWKSYLQSTPGVPDTERDQLVRTIGRFKTILDLRHWVAHGRYWKFTREITSYPPILVARQIDSLYDALRKIADYGKITAFE